MKTKETAAIVRFGQAFYVVVGLPARKRVVTQEWAEAHALTRHPFDGPATRSNQSCAAAWRAAAVSLETWGKA